MIMDFSRQRSTKERKKTEGRDQGTSTDQEASDQGTSANKEKPPEGNKDVDMTPRDL